VLPPPISVDDLVLPPEYRAVFDSVLERLDSLGAQEMNPLLLTALTGSGGSGSIIPGWSDLDFLLVYEDNLSAGAYGAARSFCDAQNIHVGTTVYAKHAFEHGMVDAKTANSLLRFDEGTLYPLHNGPCLHAPRISRRMVRMHERGLVPSIIHDVQRSLSSKHWSARPLYKQCIDLMKFTIRQSDIEPCSYADTLSGFSRLYPEVYTLPPPQVVMQMRNADVGAMVASFIQSYLSQCIVPRPITRADMPDSCSYEGGENA